MSFHLLPHLLFLCADDTPLSSRDQLRARQHVMLMHLIAPEVIAHRYNPAYEAIREKDVCEWAGVTCDNGVATAISMYGHKGVQVDWLPSTIQRVHMQSTFLLGGCQTPMLPRELRFMYIGYSYASGDGAKELDLTRLPANLEEFICSMTRGLLGDIVITHLPTRMTMLVLHSKRGRNALIDTASLPASLRLFVYDVKGRKDPWRFIGDGALVGTEFVYKDRNSLQQSAYYHDTCKRADTSKYFFFTEDLQLRDKEYRGRR